MVSALVATPWNTMEQKHQMLTKYQHLTIWQQRWERTFRHEFIHIDHLRLNGFDRKKYVKKSSNYVPVFEEGSCSKCGLAVSGLCVLCDHKDMVGVIAAKRRRFV